MYLIGQCIALLCAAGKVEPDQAIYWTRMCQQIGRVAFFHTGISWSECGPYSSETKVSYSISCVHPACSHSLFRSCSVNKQPDIPTFLDVRAVMSYFLFSAARPAVRDGSNQTQPQPTSN